MPLLYVLMEKNNHKVWNQSRIFNSMPITFPILSAYALFYPIFSCMPTQIWMYLCKKTPGRLLFIIYQVFFFHICYYYSSSIYTSGITLFSSWLWFSSDSTLDCICRTDFAASSTTDTFRTVGVFHRVYDHLAGFCTFSAFYTLILIHSVFIQGHRIKYGIKCSQGTDIFTKRTVD